MKRDLADSNRGKSGSAMAAKADPNDIGYCGIYGPECPSQVGKIADLARDLRKELRVTRYEKAAEQLSKNSFLKALEHYPECYEVLGQMVKMRCQKICKTEGGIRLAR